MSSHAKPSPRWLDTLAAYLTLVVAFLRLSWRVSTGRHAHKPTGEIDWPTGADLAYAEWLRSENREPAIRREVRA